MYMMKKIFLMITISSVPLTAAAWPKWADRIADFETCKRAVQQELGNTRQVRVDETYWHKNLPDQERRLLLNSSFKQQDMRGTCDLTSRGRVASIQIQPGRFTGPGRVTVEIAKAHDL